METKVCAKCKEEKELSEFNKSRRHKTGHKSRCRLCSHQHNKKWYSENKHIERARKQERAKIPEVREKSRIRAKAYRDKNQEKIRIYHQEYYLANRDRLVKQAIDYRTDRYHKDPMLNLCTRIRSLIGSAIRDNGYSKKTKTFEIIGLQKEEFLRHLYSTFEKTYSRPYDPETDVVHIDHIIPLCTASAEEDIIKLNHYTNLQLLLAEDNLKKGSTVPSEIPCPHP